MKQSVPSNKPTALLGISHLPHRYAYMAWKLLKQYDHDVYIVNPRYDEIEETKVYGRLIQIPVPIHTLTVYVNSGKSTLLKDDILALKPERVIFNPGAENPQLVEELSKAKIQCMDACTLVLLRTHQF